MTSRATTAVLLALLLAAGQGLVACQGGSPLKPGASASPRAAASPRPARSAAPVATGAAASVLRPLGGGAVKLAGRVTLDARYATGAGGAGRLISDDGSTLIGMDGASLISDDGSTLISDDGSTLVGMDGATLIGADGATLIGADGATMVAGGRIVGAKAGVVAVPAALVGGEGRLLLGADGSNLAAGLISDDGSTALARQGAYLLAQATAPAFGDARPAAGMWVSVVDVRDGLTVPLGKDASGAEVHTVYTDARGGFAVEVPAAAATHLRVVARAPGRRDPRLALHVLTSAGGAERAIDEGEAAIAGFLRYVMARRTLDHLGFGREPLAEDDLIGQTFALAFTPVREELAKIRSGPGGEAAMEEVALLMADRVLAEAGYENLALSTEGVSPRHPDGGALAGRPAVAELRGVMRRMQARARALAGGDADPVTTFGLQPWLLAANMRREPAARYVIERPTDLFEYLTREYLAQGRNGQDEKAFDVMAALELPLLDRDRVAMAAPSLFGVALAAVAEAEGATTVDLIAQMVRDAGARLATGPRPPAPTPARTAPPPPAAPPAEPTRTVVVLAGHPGDPGTDGSVGAMDGRNRDAYFGAPFGLALDERTTPNVLYVADAGVNRIRRITLDADGGATVTSLATSLAIGIPAGLALGPDGALYVASQHSHAIFRVLPRAEGESPTERIAGDGTAGFADGPGAATRFNRPSGLSLAPDGALVVADQENNRLRRIDLADPAARVTTLAGTGAQHQVDGPLRGAPGPDAHPGAMLLAPLDVVYDEEGTLWVSEGGGAIRRVVRPDAPGARLELFAGMKFKSVGVHDGYYHNAGLATPIGLAFDPRDGRLIVADNRNHRVRAVRPDRWITTIAGGGPGDVADGAFVDGPSDAARFHQPMDVAVAKDGTIYVADLLNRVIRRIRP